MEMILVAWAWMMGFWLTWPALAAGVCFAVYFGGDEDSTTIGSLLVAVMAASAYFFFGLTFEWWHPVAYVLIGISWSLYRFDRYGARIAAKYDYKSGEQEIVNRLSIDKNAERLTAWVAIWPISMPAWLLKDVIQILKDIVTVHLRGLFERVANRHINKASDGK